MTRPYSTARKQRAQAIRDVVAVNARARRKELGLTQQQVSILLSGEGAHEAYYRGIETGTKEISLVRLVELADTLDVTASQLLEGV